jgi:hypothetical protein
MRVQERNQLMEELQQGRALVGRLAAEKLEATQKLARAAQELGQLREAAAAERAAMWGGLLAALQLTERPLSVQDAAAAVLR